MKVVHLSSVHKVDDVRIFYKECRSLAAAGYDVTLIAKGDGDSVQDGVHIRALKTSAGSRLVRMTATVWRAWRLAVGEHADVYHFHDPELLPIGLMLKLSGSHVIYDAHEDVSGQIMTKHWIPLALRRPASLLFGFFERVIVRYFDRIITATSAIAKQFPSTKTTVVQNYPLLEETLAAKTSNAKMDRERRIVYTGGLTEIRGACEMVEAMAILGSEGVRLTIAGVIKPAELEVEMRQMPGWQSVDFVGWQDRDAMVRLLGTARAGLVLFHPAPNHAESQPNKIFEYMSAGLPVVSSDFSYWRQFVSEPGAGLMVDPLDPSAIADAVRWILDHPDESDEMGARGRASVLERYSWEREADKLIETYQSFERS